MVKIFAAAAVALSFFSAVSARCERGIPWATDDRYAAKLTNLKRITWAHHWENGHIDHMNGRIQQIMMNWGPKKYGKWKDVVGWLRKHDPAPKYLFSFNEPDVAGQSNMKDATYAAKLFMEQVYTWKKKGTKLGSPAIVWDLKWMKNFLSALKKKGGSVDFICIHWYGSWNKKGVADFKKFVQNAHKLANKPVWILEMGVTTQSGPSQKKIKNFMMETLTWLDTQPYVERVAWHGGYAINNPPDNYASNLNALFDWNGGLTDLAMWYGYSDRPDKRSRASHHLLRASDLDEPEVETNSTIAAIHCDENCLRRQQALDDETLFLEDD